MKLYSASGKLHPANPFDFEKTLDFIQGFTPMMGEQTLAARKLTKILSVEAQPILFEVKSTGTVEKSSLEYQLYSPQLIDSKTQSIVEDHIRFFLSLDDQLSDFYALARDDDHFWPVVQRIYGHHQVKFLSPFEIAAWAILTQRLPVAVARSMKQGLKEAFGSAMEINGSRYIAFPEPAQLISAAPEQLNAVIKNERKASYLMAVTQAFCGVDEQFLRTGPYKEVEDWLLNIKGIGDWSAHFILIRGLGRMKELGMAPDSIHEKILTEAVSKIYAPEKALSRDEILRIASRYGEWQGYWSYYLRALAGK